MKQLLLFLSLVTIFSCGFKVKGLENVNVNGDLKTDIPEDISFGPDFEKAAKFCDDRYGYKTEQSEECFKDFRDYLKPKLGLDISNIVEFCLDRYSDPQERLDCESEFLDFFDVISGE